ncbi:hypothetical protein A3727_16905 [Erythrobacter sp. HI0038]|nr:hypothetical protein A3727_16905 [Erythrobacter sp. HI0038]
MLYREYKALGLWIETSCFAKVQKRDSQAIGGDKKGWRPRFQLRTDRETDWKTVQLESIDSISLTVGVKTASYSEVHLRFGQRTATLHDLARNDPPRVSTRLEHTGLPIYDPSELLSRGVIIRTEPCALHLLEEASARAIWLNRYPS